MKINYLTQKKYQELFECPLCCVPVLILNFVQDVGCWRRKACRYISCCYLIKILGKHRNRPLLGTLTQRNRMLLAPSRDEWFYTYLSDSGFLKNGAHNLRTKRGQLWRLTLVSTPPPKKARNQINKIIPFSKICFQRDFFPIRSHITSGIGRQTWRLCVISQREPSPSLSPNGRLSLLIITKVRFLPARWCYAVWSPEI